MASCRECKLYDLEATKDKAGRVPPAQDEVVLDALRDAYWAGAMAVHNAWVNDLGQNDPDFGEAASDYANSAITALRQHQSAEIEALRAENARFRTALEPFAQMAEEAEIAASALQNDRDDFFVAQIGGYKIGDLYLADFQRACAALEGDAK